MSDPAEDPPDPGAVAPDGVSRHALPITVGSVAVGAGLLLVAGGIGLLDGPTGAVAPIGYAGGGVALVGFEWVFVVRSLVDLVRIGVERVRPPGRVGSGDRAGDSTPGRADGEADADRTE